MHTLQKSIFLILILGVLSFTACSPSIATKIPSITVKGTSPVLPDTWTPTPEQTANPTLPNPTQITEKITPIPAGNFVPFKRIAMTTTQDGWAWGYMDDQGIRIWHTSDGGQTWTDVSPTAKVWDFAFVFDALTAWILICPSPTGHCEETLAMTENGGSNWSVFTEPLKASLPGLRFQSKIQGVLTEYDVGAGSGFYSFSETNDGGRTWNRVEISSDPEGGSVGFEGTLQTCNLCGDLVYYDTERLILLNGNLNVTPGDAIRISISWDQGTSWRNVELEFPTADYQSGIFHAYQPIFFQDGSGILPYEVIGMADETSTMAFFTTKDGLNWTLESYVEDAGDIYHWNAMDILSMKEVFFTCGVDLCATQDGGQSWERIASNLNFDPNEYYPIVESYDFVDSLHGWALVEIAYDSYTLWRTMDGGRSWIELTPDYIIQ